MGTQNITLAIPRELLYEAKGAAAARRQSMSGWIKSLIEDAVDKEKAYEAARSRQLAIMREGLAIGIGDEIPWTRDELHERE